MKEAIEILMNIITKEFRNEQLADWRNKYGDEFADNVKAQVMNRWKK